MGIVTALDSIEKHSEALNAGVDSYFRKLYGYAEINEMLMILKSSMHKL